MTRSLECAHRRQRPRYPSHARAMSSIGSTPPGLNTTGFDPAAGQVSLDEARQQGLLRADGAVAEPGDAPAALLDPGEALLNLSAWDDAGPRMLPRDEAFSARLAGLDHAEAANAAAEGILAAL